MILSKRPAKLGGSINARTEKHGEESVPAFDLPLNSIMLTREELNAFMREPLTSVAWFNDRKDGLAEPLLRNIDHFAISDKYEDSSVSIEVGLKVQLYTIENCKISKIKLTPCVGGLTELRCTVSAKLEGVSPSIFEWMSSACDVEIHFGEMEKSDPRQPELALTPATDEAPNVFDDEDATAKAEAIFGKPKRGRKARNADGDSVN